MDNLCEEGRRVIIWDGLDIYTYVWTVWDWNLMMNSNHYFRDGFYINPSRSSHILYVRLILLCNFTAQEFTAVVSKISTVLISWQFLKKKIFWRILVNQTRSCSYACCFSLILSIQSLVICVVRKYLVIYWQPFTVIFTGRPFPLWNPTVGWIYVDIAASLGLNPCQPNWELLIYCTYNLPVTLSITDMLQSL